VNRNVARKVGRRAHDRCEYCRLPVSVYPLPFSVDHIVARQHGGPTVLENLALACLHCNRHKGPNIAGADPRTGEIVRLFHPRLDRWSDHFEWMRATLTGRTSIGRVTIQVLAINDPDFLAVREALIQEQSFSLE
jgi:5-methylcytosine-specific restriction endonuclease McrA